MNTLSPPASKPWYREFWPWFLISLPATAVIAGVTTAAIAATSADGLVVGDYYKAGLAINQTLARDDVAQALALTATLKHEDGALALTPRRTPAGLPGSTQAHAGPPDPSGAGQTLAFSHAGGRALSLVTAPMRPGKWHALLADAAPPGGLPVCCTPPSANPSRSRRDARIHLSNPGRLKWMSVLNLLLPARLGLLSLFTILFIIGMAIYLVRMYRRKMNDPDE